MLVLLHLFSLFLLVTLGFYVFVADPRARTNQTFAAFIAVLALWTIKDLIFWNFEEARAEPGWWVASSFVIALAMQCALVVFAWVFPENGRIPRSRMTILFAPTLVLVPAALFGTLWDRVDVNNGRFSIELGPLAYIFVGYVYFMFFYGASILYRKYRLYQHTQMGQQVGAIIWGLVITGILKTLANILLPFFGIYEMLPLSAIFVLPGVFIYAYAISNFRMFSLQTALDQFRLFGITSKIALSIAAVAIMSFLIFQVPIAWWSFKNGQTFDAWRKYLVFSVISALVPNLLLLLLVVRTISRPLQRITLAAVKVTNGEYGTEADLRPSNDEIGLLADSFNEMSRKMASDIEDQRRLNDQLMRTDKLAAMGTLAAGVAHEVNNPLASISSLVQMIKGEKERSTDIDEKLDLISTQIGRITRVTKDLTDFARTHPAARSRVDINSLLKKSLRLAEFDSAFQKLSITEELETKLPDVLADGDQLQQVFLNLFLNARDAMPSGGEVRIMTKAQNREITVEITDSGPGIDDETIKHVFDPFYTTKPTGKGTGLGLAVCYGIVTAHGGRIELIRNDPTGTRLVVTLPQVVETV